MKRTAIIRVVTTYLLREEFTSNNVSDEPTPPNTSLIENYYRLYDSHGSLIGELVLDDATTSAAPPGQDPGSWEIVLITLSGTQSFRSHTFNVMSRGNMYELPFEYTLYNVVVVGVLMEKSCVEEVWEGCFRVIGTC